MLLPLKPDATFRRRSRSKPNAAGDTELTVGGVVDVRVVRDADEPASPVDVDADGPACDEPLIAVTALVHCIDGQAPLARQVPSQEHVCVRLLRVVADVA